MKQLLILLFSLILFSSCSKDEDSKLDEERDTAEFAIKVYMEDRYNKQFPYKYESISFPKFERLSNPVRYKVQHKYKYFMGTQTYTFIADFTLNGSFEISSLNIPSP